MSPKKPKKLKKLEKILEWTCKVLLTAATVISAIAQLIAALK